MTDIEKQIIETKELFNTLISQARSNDITVNLWINSTGPASLKPSELELDFGIKS
jgi:hypothetical protein